MSHDSIYGPWLIHPCVASTMQYVSPRMGAMHPYAALRYLILRISSIFLSRIMCVTSTAEPLDSV